MTRRLIIYADRELWCLHTADWSFDEAISEGFVRSLDLTLGDHIDISTDLTDEYDYRLALCRHQVEWDNGDMARYRPIRPDGTVARNIVLCAGSLVTLFQHIPISIYIRKTTPSQT